MDFSRTTLIEVDRILRERYPNSLSDYKEKRDNSHTLIETLRITTNATHRLEMKNVFDGWLWYREVPLDPVGTLRQSVTKFAESLDLPPFVHKLNELLNQRAWEQAAVEEKLAMQKIADMWAIVQEVATENSTRYIDNWGHSECPFCDGNPTVGRFDNVDHEPDCIVTKARAMVKAEDQGS